MRYADDCNIYVQSRQAGERVLTSAERFLKDTLRLTVNREKSAVDRPWSRKFLGYSFTSFLAVEANAFRLGDFNFNATVSSPSGDANVRSSLDMWGGSFDVLGIIPLGDAWRVYGRAGVIVVQSNASYEAALGGTTRGADHD